MDWVKQNDFFSLECEQGGLYQNVLPYWNKKSREQKVAGTNCHAKILRDFATFCSRDFLFSDFAQH